MLCMKYNGHFFYKVNKSSNHNSYITHVITNPCLKIRLVKDMVNYISDVLFICGIAINLWRGRQTYDG